MRLKMYTLCALQRGVDGACGMRGAANGMEAELATPLQVEVESLECVLEEARPAQGKRASARPEDATIGSS